MANYRMDLMLCAGTGCVSNKSFQVRDAIRAELEKQGLQGEIRVVPTGCQGFCAQGDRRDILISQRPDIYIGAGSQNNDNDRYYRKGRFSS